MTLQTTHTIKNNRITIKDRNLIAFLLALGCKIDITPRTDGPGVDGEIEWSDDLDRACSDYHRNVSVPVQSFIQACRYISNQIALQRQR